MKRIMIFGGGRYGHELIDILSKRKDVEVIGILDNHLRGEVKGIPVYQPSEVQKKEYDYICLALDWVDEAVEQLLDCGVDFFKINTSFLMNKGIGSRKIFLEHFAKEVYRKGLRGEVAEAGVFKGVFAAEINRVFPDKKLFLFDTFEGFDVRDISLEGEKAENPLSNADYFRETSEDVVMQKMIYPQNVVIKKGYVPDTFCGINEVFCFVNLDLDLYKPTSEALKWFWPRIVPGGGILVHDYYNDYSYPNLKKACIEFANKEHINYFPIGDGMSVFIMKGA